MARLPYVNSDSEIAQRIRDRRGGEFKRLDGMLLHSPGLADGWNHLFGVLRGDLELASDLRELGILRIAVLNGSEYEWDAHEGPGRAAGLTDEQLVAVRRDQIGTGEHVTPFSEAQYAVLAYTDALTRTARVPDEVFDSVRRRFTDREVVELTLVVSAYNMVSRFLNALDVGEPAAQHSSRLA